MAPAAFEARIPSSLGRLLALLVSLACSRQAQLEHPVSPPEHPDSRQPAHPAHAEAAERGTAFVGRSAPLAPRLDVRLLGFLVADDDGRRRARVAPAHVSRWVDFANDVYRPAGIRFLFEPQDLLPLRSSRINDLYDDRSPGYQQALREADDLAGRYPDRLVVFFRHGPGRRGTGRGFSGIHMNFVVMPGWLDDRHCGHEHLGSFAHELGHHLGLAHTFPRAPFRDAAEAEAFFVRAGRDVSVFDGDGLTDTPPDPPIRSTECLDYQAVELAGVRFPLPRRNIMSYYDTPDSLTPQQITRVRWYARLRSAYRMKLPRNQPAAALELERLELATRSGQSCSAQPMAGFDGARWSAEHQLFCPGRGRQSLTLKLPVARSGWQRVELYATRAPDFGIVQAYLDGQPLGGAFDAWGLDVLATGAIPLGVRRLAAGTHELTFVVLGKNPASTGFHIGLDALALVPLEPES